MTARDATNRAVEAVFRIESARLIAGLARLVRDALKRPAVIAPDGASRLCPAGRTRCALEPA